MGPFFGNFALEIAQAGLSYRQGPWVLDVGALPAFDVVQSPYSLFVNGQGLSVPGVYLSYEDERFNYSQRWLHLGSDSDYGWSDRGAVIKTYGVRWGELRFGFQDAAVVSGVVLDPLDVLLPAPSFFVQYVALAPGRPWTQDSSAPGANKNSIMGFYADYQGSHWYAYAQILVDDLNMNRFFNPSGPQNPDKLALSLGGHYDHERWGRLGAYAAMALKYTFQAYGHTGINTEYGYTRYPATAYRQGEDPWQLIEMSQNMLGYQQGENDLSFRMTWDHEPWQGGGVFGPLGMSSALELSLTGPQSPGNPWHQYLDWKESVGGQDGVLSTAFLDGPRLRTRLGLTSSLALPVKAFLLCADFQLGYEWHRMELVDVAPPVGEEGVNDQPLLVPGENGGFFGYLKLGLRYALSL